MRAGAFAMYHPIGTCRMGDVADPSSVVDPELRVKNIRQLRVIDAAVMPNLPSCNTNGPTIMVAERASAFVLGTKQTSRNCARAFARLSVDMTVRSRRWGGSCDPTMRSTFRIMCMTTSVCDQRPIGRHHSAAHVSKPPIDSAVKSGSSNENSPRFAPSTSSEDSLRSNSSLQLRQYLPFLGLEVHFLAPIHHDALLIL